MRDTPIHICLCSEAFSDGIHGVSGLSCQHGFNLNYMKSEMKWFMPAHPRQPGTRVVTRSLAVSHPDTILFTGSLKWQMWKNQSIGRHSQQTLTGIIKRNAKVTFLSVNRKIYKVRQVTLIGIVGVKVGHSCGVAVKRNCLVHGAVSISVLCGLFNCCGNLIESIRDTRSLPTNSALKPTAMSLQGLINHVFRECRAIELHRFCFKICV